VRAATTALSQHQQCRYESTQWDSTKIPSFAAYKSKGKEEDNRVFGYLMAGSFGALTAMGAKATVVGRSIEAQLDTNITNELLPRFLG
jgi:ubiquinol-cytochrome c reductase iron-sulfur subunit